MENERTYRVGLAVMTLTGLFTAPLGQALRESWTPGATASRYRRTWTLAKMQSDTGRVITGRIGFVTEAGVQTMFFDKDTGDFVTRDAPSGTVVPFAVRLSDGVIAYQLRPGLVRENSFTGALEAVLNAGPTLYQWSIEQAVEERTWEAWRSEVGRIDRFNIRVDRPNPHYEDDYLIEQAVEDTKLELLRLQGRAQSDGLDPDADLFAQALHHVMRGYGAASVSGVVDQSGAESVWVKLKGMASRVATQFKITGVGDPEIPEEELVQVLSNAPSNLEGADMSPELIDGLDDAFEDD